MTAGFLTGAADFGFGFKAKSSSLEPSESGGSIVGSGPVCRVGLNIPTVAGLGVVARRIGS